MHPNYLLPLEDLRARGRTSSTADLGPGLRVGIGEADAELTFEADGALHLSPKGMPGPFQWCELAMVLPDQEAWLASRRVHLQLRARADQPVDLAPALRLIGEDGFHDHFAAAPLEIGTEAAWAGCVLPLSPRLLEGVGRIDLHLFLSRTDHSLTLFDLAVTGTH
ncbi:hypothetical protein [Pseudoponticoccus marisrubri]|uniref:NADH:ubiquinone oxidoreductase intermediate-associated protein 30 domain-containing protein n=1 Tax=Pseudoponticoccus marisrubri TaxID=1685382 RepID=A0A0W7WER1_9RHOB|nr:hypothetical protein [Pseudoponticoccus marisrubri]KUF08967.1 hypothetical protein AVJ23_19965 [Pseudoponticoccus marisrubri]